VCHDCGRSVNFCMTLSVPETKFQVGISLFKINYGKIFVFRALDWLNYGKIFVFRADTVKSSSLGPLIKINYGKIFVFRALEH